MFILKDVFLAIYNLLDGNTKYNLSLTSKYYREFVLESIFMEFNNVCGLIRVENLNIVIQNAYNSIDSILIIRLLVNKLVNYKIAINTECKYILSIIYKKYDLSLKAAVELRRENIISTTMVIYTFIKYTFDESIESVQSFVDLYLNATNIFLKLIFTPAYIIEMRNTRMFG